MFKKIITNHKKKLIKQPENVSLKKCQYHYYIPIIISAIQYLQLPTAGKP